jgi:hypothetical protein
VTVQNSDGGDSRETPDWLVYRVDGPNEKLLGTVIAPTSQAALVAAFKQFNVTPAGRKRIIVWKTSRAR